MSLLLRNSDGFTGFRHLESGHDISVNLQFGPGQVDAERFRTYEAAYGVERANQLRRLVETLQRKSFTVSKFVRVACPSRGTILASGRSASGTSIC